LYQTVPLQAVNQSYNAVVLEIETFRKLTNGRLFAAWKPLDRQQRLVLLGGEPGDPRRILAEGAELSQ
jgi:hypothetical protein